MKKQKALISSGIVAAIASSLCCIVPLLVIVAGSTGAVSGFSWLESLRPYLIGFTVLVLGFAWYQKLKPQEECCENEKTSFIQSKLFLFFVSLFALGMLALPNYSKMFYSSNSTEISIPEESSTLILEIQGMTCAACENHITHALGESKGVLKSTVSYEKGTATIIFDAEQTDIKKLSKIIKIKTGYDVLGEKK